MKSFNQFKEEMMAGNAVGSSGGFSSSADAKGPVAGYDKGLCMKKKSFKRTLELQNVSYIYKGNYKILNS